MIGKLLKGKENKMSVKEFLKVFRNGMVTVDIVGMGDENIATVKANGKDILKDEISGRTIYDIKIVNAQNVKVIVTEDEDTTDDTPTPTPDDTTDPTGTP